MTLNISPQIEAKLYNTARREGIDLAALIEKMFQEYETSHPQNETQSRAVAIDAENASAIAQLEAWMQEDANDDPEEIRKAEEDLAEFKRNMNANRVAVGDHPVYP